MSEQKHTPGPWSLVETPDEKMISSWHVQIGEDRVSVFPYTRQYSECRQYSGLVTDHQKMADARLIASAPELLEALEGMIQVYGGGTQWDPPTSTELQLHDMARAAIAKATQ